MQRIHEIPKLHAYRTPDAVCLYQQDGTSVSYGELWQSVQEAAQWLTIQGVRPGHRVMLVAENCAEHVALLFACSLIGAWPVGVNARLSATEIRAIAEHSEPFLLIFTTHCSPAAQQHAQAFGARPIKAPSFHKEDQYAIYRPDAAAEASGQAEQVATLVYTSGTTGAPKGVMVTHRGLLHFAGVSSQSRKLTPSDIAYAALPLSHIFGIATVLLATLYAGASLVLRARFDPQDLLKSFAQPGITILQGVPTMFVRLMDALPSEKPETPKLRYVYTGGAALDPALKKRVEQRFGQPMHHGYGITEYAGSMFVTRIDAPRTDTSAGYAVDGVELMIVKEGKKISTPGVDGDILIRGPGVMLGYYRSPEQTRQALLSDGWLNTGDIGHVDADGALFLTGRSKDLIIRSGFNVYPLEIEAVLNAFPGIRLSAVVGKSASDGNEEVVAFYEAEHPDAIDHTALREFVAQRLAPYKRPSQYIYIEAIPTTASGKLRKEPLKSRFS